MATYVYRRASSIGARELALAIGGKRFRGRVSPITSVLRAGDTVICWGETLPAIPGVRILNGGPIQNKLQDALKLREAGVATIEAVRQIPVQPPVIDETALRNLWAEAIESAEDFVEIPYDRTSPVFTAGITDFAAKLDQFRTRLANPGRAAAPVVWLPRVSNHVGGTDLLTPPTAPDYFVRKEELVAEVRVHSFLGKSVRAGKKVQRSGVPNPHPWVRSYDGGWGIVYDGFESNRQQRELAHAAVKALGLDFGAVDLAQKGDGSWLVLEVNRAPGLEGNTTGIYASAIRSWRDELPAAAQRAA